MYVVSKCLLGVKCKYNGGHNLSAELLEFLRDKKYITVCPECAGGLAVPRPPAEIQANGRVLDKNGRDVTHEFNRGAVLSLKSIYRELMLSQSFAEDKCISDFIKDGILTDSDGQPVTAVLKAYSPSCGCGYIYDGSFTKKIIEGYGIAARLFKQNGIQLMTEMDFANNDFKEKDK